MIPDDAVAQFLDLKNKISQNAASPEDKRAYYGLIFLFNQSKPEGVPLSDYLKNLPLTKKI